MPRNANHECRSLSRHVRILVGSAAIAALAATGAFAEDAKINSMSFETMTPYKKNTIQVTSSTGEKWDTIVPGQVEFWAAMQVDTKHPGYVKDAGIFLGPCVNTQCGQGSPLVFLENVNRRDYGQAKNISFSTSKLQTSGILPAVVPYGDEALFQCNKKLQPDGATKPHDFDMPITLAFTVNTRKDAGTLGPQEVTDADQPWGGGDETRHGEFIAHVECLANAKSTAQSNPDPHRNKITVSDLDLFLATVVTPGSSSRGPSGTQCKPVRVTTRITTDKAGPVTVKQWRQVNGGPITSEDKQMNAAAIGGGKFGDDWVKVEQFSKTTTVQYKDEVVGGTFAPSTPWKSITVHCNGDFASPTSDANPDKRKKEAEKAREREANARLVDPLILRPRPLIGPMVYPPPRGPRPLIGVGRPLGPHYGAHFASRRPLMR
jgi:hypothetical protein